GLPGVATAALNTTTGKLTVVGEADLEAIRRLGRAEDYVITAERQPPSSAGPAAVAELWRAAISAVLLLSALALPRVGPVTPDAAVSTLLLGAVVVGGWSNARRALHALLRFDFNMSVLMTTAVIGAIAIGEWHEAAVVAVLFAVSDWLEA